MMMNGLPNCVAEERLLAMQRRDRELDDLWDWLAEYMEEHGLSADDVRRAVCRVERLGSDVDDALEYDPSWSIACVPSPPFDRASIARHWKAMKEEIKRLRLEVGHLQNTGSHRPIEPEANKGSVG